MKILIIVNQFPCITETFVLNQIVGLINRGNDVQIYAANKGSCATLHPDVDTYDLRNKAFYTKTIPQSIASRLLFYATCALKWPTLFMKSIVVRAYGREVLGIKDYSPGWFLSEVAAFQGKRRYDIVYCMYGTSGQKAVLFRRLGLITGKIVTAFFGYDLSGTIQKYGNNFYNALFRDGDLFFPLSRLFADILQELGCSKEKIIVHHVGISPHTFSASRRSQDPSCINILSVGRLSLDKGHEYGIRAIAPLIEKYPITYSIVGDGELRPRIADLISSMKLDAYVFLLGFKNQPELRKILEETDIFILPSIPVTNVTEEGTPVALMEAMSMEIPVIASKVGSVAELVSPECGIVVQAGNVDELQASIETFIKDKSKRQKFGGAARQRVCRLYNMEIQNNRLSSCFERLIG